MDSWGGETSGIGAGGLCEDSLGNGTATGNKKVPVAVSTVTNVMTIGVGTDQGYAIEGDGTLWAWGKNANGELGQGNTAAASTPVKITTVGNVTAINGGFQFTLTLGQASSSGTTSSPQVIG